MTRSAPGGLLLTESVRCTRPHPTRASEKPRMATDLSCMGGKYKHSSVRIQTSPMKAHAFAEISFGATFPYPARTYNVLFFILIIIGITLGNIAWWRWADRHARSLSRAWRAGVGIFFGSQI